MVEEWRQDYNGSRPHPAILLHFLIVNPLLKKSLYRHLRIRFIHCLLINRGAVKNKGNAFGA